MEGNQFHRRVFCIFALFVVLLIAFFSVLYDLQIRRGDAFLQQSRRKIAKTETVEAVRGDLFDRYGRVLISNRTTYEVKFDTSLMGKQKNEILTALLGIARAQNVTWVDTLPVSEWAPFQMTITEAGTTAATRFQKMKDKRKWTASNADALLQQMCVTYEVAETLTLQEKRDLLGLRYELDMRASDIARTEYIFTQDVQIDFITAVKESRLAGVNIAPTTVREYRTPYAAHLLGRVALMDADEWKIYQEKGYAMDETVGRDGMEKAFEDYLHGNEGVRAIETNTQGKVVSSEWLPDDTGALQVPTPGGQVMTTLDIRLQEAAERALATRMGELKAATKGAAAVVIDVKNGGVLASASYPTFDTGIYSSTAAYDAASSDPLNPLFNRATQGVYSPGSTFKMVVATGALEENLITASEKIRCTGVYSHEGWDDTHPRCWIYRQSGGSHGLETVTEAVRDSCNIFFYESGRRLGIDGIEKYAQMFGLGVPTGIEVLEQTGINAGPRYTHSKGQTWYEGSVLPAAIGQENNQFTPLQLANYVATLANGGTHYSAHLLKEVRSNDFSQVLYQRAPEELNRIDITPENLEVVKKGMLLVTQPGGSAYQSFKDLDVQVAAKTGSAQVTGQETANAAFVCFAPYDDPKIAVAIVVEQGGSGGALADMAADIVGAYFAVGETHTATVQPENVLLP